MRDQLTITEVLQLYPRTKAEKWKQHPNGEGWIHEDAKVSPEAFIGPRVAVRGGTIEGGTILGGTILGGTILGGTIWGGTIKGGTIKGGTIWGGTILGGTITDKAIVKIGEDYVTLLSVAEWGAITGHRTTDGWVIVCGCRRFTLAEAMDHWKGREDRTGTRMAVDVIAQIAKQRGWDLTADKENK
ncbi:MAG TPA: hypothetical protein VNH83_28295 [Bryobacteraceae bacterium]|nr:hypothetical protein [Bryobacteraceae bacterium]